MSDHNFEKQIQQKLEELKIPPSDTVWTSVEAQIRKEKRRRRGIVFFPILFILLGTGFYLVFQNKFSSSNDRASEIVSTNSTSKNSTPNKKNNTSEQTKTENELASEKRPQDNPTSSTKQPGIENVQEEDVDKSTVSEKKVEQKRIDRVVPFNERTSNAQPPSKKVFNRSDDIIKSDGIIKSDDIVKSNKDFEKERSKDILTHQKTGDDNVSAKTGTEISGKQKQQPSNTPVDKEIVAAPDSSGNKIADNAGVNRVTDSTISNDLTRVKPVDSSLMTSVPEETKIGVKKTKSSNWKWGINGSAGISNLSDESFFGGIVSGITGAEKALVLDLAPAAYNAPPSNAGPQAVIYEPSTIEKGFSFSFGAFVQKNISKRFSVSTGLQYSFYSTHIQVGNRIDSSALVQNAVGSLNVSQFYRSAPVTTTREYTNRFHFVELPVSVHAQLNKGKRLPIFWNAGLSLSYLVSTNALHFDSRTGVYYKDNGLFNKLQSNLSTGFSVSLWNSSRMPVNIGPQLQYGLTNFMKHEVDGSRHLFFLGLNAKVFLKK